MTKVTKAITLDVDLIASLEKLELNISKYCNEKLWDYVTDMQKIEEVYEESQENIQEQIEKLKIRKESIERDKELALLRKEAGITPEKIKFLKSMSTSIMAAKDMKFAWLNKFGEKLEWDELRNLKSKWAP